MPDELVQSALNKYRAMKTELKHVSQVYRLLPWTFPRACDEAMNPEHATRGFIEVETLDLLHSCPAWIDPAPEAYPFRPAMRALRERWSHKIVTIGAPEGIDMSSLAYFGCATISVWRVLGPTQFIREVKEAVEAPDIFPEALPWEWRPERRVDSMFLCQHEIRGD